MISGIAALVEGGQKLSKWTRLWGLYLAGSALGGVAAFLTVWVLATPVRTLLPRSGVAAIFVAVAAACLLSDLDILQLRGPQRQVPARWERQYGPTLAYFLYGIWLGSGFLTFVPYALAYAACAAGALFLDAPQVLVAGTLFGVGRSFLTGPATLAGKSFVSSLSESLRFCYAHLPKVSAVAIVALLLSPVYLGLY